MTTPKSAQIEYHPRLDPQNLKIGEKKIILGSFPIASLSRTQDIRSRIISPNVVQESKKGEFPFFYGSSKSQFWIWYKRFVDTSVSLLNVVSIKGSLIRNQIGITDVILSCKRKGESSLDKDLYQRSYNHGFFLYPKRNETLKILCTSKGVMNGMLLRKDFFSLHTVIRHDNIQSGIFQNEFLQKVNGNIDLVKTPIAAQLSVDNGGIIQCLAIPSPGSPYRKLNEFGIGAADLEVYLFETFKWLRD